MKTPNDHIHVLIQSMTASEKRYFKMHFVSEKSLITELFDYLNSLEKYDEQQVKNYFSNSKLSKNLKVYKVQLSDLILKSLSVYHYKKGVEGKICAGLEEIKILLVRSLHLPATNKLKQLKKLCLKHEQFQSLITALQLECQLPLKNDEEKKQILQLINHYSSKLSHIAWLKYKAAEFQELCLNEQFFVLNDDKLSEKALILQEFKAADNQPISFLEEYYQNDIVASAQRLFSKDKFNEIESRLKNINLLKQQSNFKELYAYSYWQALYFYGEALVLNHQFETWKTFLPELKNFLKEFPWLHHHRLQIYYLEIAAAYNFNQMKEVENIGNQLMEYLETREEQDNSLLLLCYIYLAVANLSLHRHRRVQFYLRRLHKIAKKQSDVFSHFGDALELISNYETQDFFVIQNLLASYKRKQYYRKTNLPFFDALFELFTKFSKIEMTEHSSFAAHFLTQLDNYKGEHLCQLLQKFILKDWLTAIVNQQKYGVKQQVVGKSQ